MRRLKCLAVDDEEASLWVISHFIKQRKDLELVDATRDPLTVSEKVDRLGVELVFVDLHMQSMHGIDLIKSIAGRVEVICCTGHYQYGPELFELDVAYYLTKPIFKKQFNKAIRRVWNRVDNSLQAADGQLAEQLDLDDYIWLKLEATKYKNFQLLDIECLEATGDYTHVIYTDGKIRSPLGIGSLESKLPSAHFIRVHKSYIVARKNIGHIDFAENRLTLRNSAYKEPIPLGRRYKKIIQDSLYGKN